MAKAESNAAMAVQTSATAIAVERKLIRTGNLEFQTNDAALTKAEIERLCKEQSGYISSESQNSYNNRLNHSLQIRVPSERFFDLLTKIEQMGSRTESKHISTQDVTEEFIDVEARLKTKKSLEQRYLELLKQAKSLTDVIALESQIATVRSEIESMQGRLNYLQNQISLSTLNVTYFETLGTDFGFASKFVESLRNGWNNLLGFLIGFISLWPFIVIFIGGSWFLLRRRRIKKAILNDLK
jgi:hypothetical protein